MNSFKNLEERLHIPLFTAKDFESSETKIPNKKTDAFGIVIDIENSKNPISKLKYLFKGKSKLKKYKKLLENTGLDLTVFGIYPNIDKPLVIYPLHSNAEVYSNNNILPFVDKNKIKGFVLSILRRFLKFNPSVRALIIACYKTDNDLFQKLFNDQIFLKSSKKSLLSLSTTNNVYLIFDDSEQPNFAIHEIDESDIKNKFDIQNKLFNILGDTIAEPIKIIKHHDKCYLVEKGLTGKPWFQLATESKNNWYQIKIKSLLSLNHFQKSINLEKLWHKEINLADELKKQYLESRKYNQLDTPKIKKYYDFFYSQLANIDSINSQFQHGDFCINNILHDKEKTHIIDFEDFGKTLVPLQDNFSLALSFFQIEGSVTCKDLVNEINLCLSYSQLPFNFSKEVVSALFFHQLMFRLGTWSNKDTRTDHKKWILIILDDFLTNHSEFLSNLEYEPGRSNHHQEGNKYL